VTKRNETTEAEAEATVDENIHLLYEHIKHLFIINARVIAESQKPETLLKMIQSCKEIQPVDRSNEEVWKTVQKVRQEVLGQKSGTPAKPEPSKRRRVKP
jgi:hypothetical protein